MPKRTNIVARRYFYLGIVTLTNAGIVEWGYGDCCVQSLFQIL